MILEIYILEINLLEMHVRNADANEHAFKKILIALLKTTLTS